MNVKQKFYEGYWKSSREPHLPMPVHMEAEWPLREAFLKRLSALEARATVTRYRGFSLCRCCDAKNGNAEYTDEGVAVSWTWPEGYKHYIAAHNVVPSVPFMLFVFDAETVGDLRWLLQ